MDEICGSYPIIGDTGETGRLDVKKEGLFYVLDARCESAPGVRGLYIISGGKRVRLGTLAPEDGAHRLKKRMTKNALSELGIVSIDQCHAGENVTPVVSEAQWRPEQEPGRLFSDPETAQSCKGVKGALLRDVEGGAVQLAIPLEFGRPFLPISIFCYGSWKKLNGRGYLVFTIRDGRPVV